MRIKTFCRRAAALVIALLLSIQLVPYGRDHTNPAARQEPPWDRPETRALARRACYDCHSNETVWPWYSHVAPISWLIQRDVDQGRRQLNFSQWNRPQKEAKDSAEEVREGEMPPWFYLPTHPEARLTAAEREQLAKGLEATVARRARREDD